MTHVGSILAHELTIGLTLTSYTWMRWGCQKMGETYNEAQEQDQRGQEGRQGSAEAED